MTTEVPTTPVIGLLRNEWRQRTVRVYDHPTHPETVISVGTPFDGSRPVVCEEPRDQYLDVIRKYPREVVYH